MADPIEATRGVLERFSRRDLDGLLAPMQPDVELRSALVSGGTSGGVFRGHEGIREWFAAVWEAWDAFEVELVQGISVGPLVLVLARVQARGHLSGVDLVQTYGGVLRWQEDRISGWYTYLDPADAFEEMARQLRSAGA